MNIITIKELNEINEGARMFLEYLKTHNIIAFYGDMGIGKTTFIKAVCQELGVTDIVTSPTFSIINEYHTNDNRIVYHFDCYRIENIQEAFDFGYEDYFFNNKICFIEWPEKIKQLLPEKTLSVFITQNKKGERIIEIKP